MKISLEEQKQIRRKLQKSNSILEEIIVLLHQAKTSADYTEQLTVCSQKAGEVQSLLKEIMSMTP